MLQILNKMATYSNLWNLLNWCKIKTVTYVTQFMFSLFSVFILQYSLHLFCDIIAEFIDTKVSLKYPKGGGSSMMG